MFRTMIKYGSAPLIAATLLFLIPHPSPAAGHGGGGHFGGFGGGFHAGGFHAGGFNYGGLHAGGLPYGGYHYGGFHPYNSFYRPYNAYSRYHGYGSGYYPYLGGYYPYSYGYYPDYGYSFPNDAGSYPSASAEPAFDVTAGPGYTSSYYSPASTDGSASPVQGDTLARLTVSVPPDAELWFDAANTSSTGGVREFNTPPLTPGKHYSYNVRARWMENGHEVTQTQKVQLIAGSHLTVTFPVSPAPADRKATGG
jgi:uncharacterized protein (TIGR03000 family)